MENNTNRRLLIIIGFVVFLVIIVLVWYFYYAKPVIDPTSDTSRDPIPQQENKPRSGFIFPFWDTPETTSTTEVIDPLQEPLVKLWNQPATGQTFVVEDVLKEITASSTEGTSTVMVKRTVRATSTFILFVDRTTGYVHKYNTELGKTFQVSNSVFPGIHDAYIFDNGKRIIMRYIDQEKNNITSIVATIPSVSDNQDASPLENIQYLTGEVSSVAISKNKKEASYIVTTSNGSSIYTIRASNKPELVTSSPFKDWTLSYGGNSLFVTTKPSAYVEGSTFSIPSFELQVADKTGLLSIQDSSNFLFNSMWSKSGIVTFFVNNGDIQVLSVKTLPSKCRFSFNNFIICGVPRTLPSNSTEGLPDDWFQGRTLFADDIMMIDKKSGESYTVYSFNEKEGEFDIVNLDISEGSDMYSFTRKQDRTLWLLNTNLIRG